jgi:cytochrome c-type biogenesis protein CcmH
MRRLLFALLFLSSAAFAERAPETLPNPAQEARAQALQKQFRCLVCQGESIDESGAPLAADLRRLIREHIVRGESDAQIKDYLVARYGDFILMNPPVQPDTYVLWAAPFVVLLLAAGAGTVVVLRARRRTERDGSHPSTGSG